MLKRWICCVGRLAVLHDRSARSRRSAHDLPLDRMMNGFVKIEPHQADFVVRVPLDLLRGVPFPLAGDHYNIRGVQARRRNRAQGSGHRFRALGRQRSSRAFERHRPAGAALGSLVRRL